MAMLAKVAQVARVEPHMALKSVAPATVVMAKPPRNVSYEFLSRVIELLGNIGVRCHLTHEDKKRDDGEPVRGERLEESP